MFKKDTRKGLALGAAFSLIASLFVAAPAAQADENGVVVTPFVGTSNTMLITEEFVIKTRLGLNVTATRINNLKYLVEKPAGYNLTVSNTVSAVLTGGTHTAVSTTVSNIAAADTFSYITPSDASNTGINQLRLSPWSASALTSVSKAVTVKVTAFLDIDPDGKFNSASEPFQVYEVKFVPWADLAASVTLTQPVFGAITASATAAVSGVNFEQLNGDFLINIATTYGSGSSTSGSLNDHVATGTMSASFPVSASAPVDSSVSATIGYDADKGGTIATGEALKVSKLGVANATLTAVTASAVEGDNLVATDDDNFEARLNSTFAIKVWALTNSTVVAAKVPTFTVTTSNAALSTTQYIVVNGTTYTTSAGLIAKTFDLTAGTDGKGTITISTVGFDDADTITVKFSSENQSDEVVINTENPNWTVKRSAGNYLVTTTGTAVTAEFSVEDQFEVASALTDQQVVFSIAGTGFSTSTVAAAVVGAKASVTANPSATATGSYTITPNLQYRDRNSGNWVDESGATETAVTVYVQSTIVNSFSTKPTATASASISYGAAMSWSGAITANVAVTGSEVVVSATGVIFQYDSKTYSDTVKMSAGVGGAVSFKATSRKAGKYTISFVAGAATGSTILTVDAAAASAAKDITFDKTTLALGATTTITGTVADENGNPIKTSGSDVVVSWTGKGLPFGTGTLATDADGKFSINVLVLASETGTGTLTATYRPSSSATDTKNISVVKTFAIDAPVVVPTPEVNAVIGTYNGRWAVRVENAKGATVAVKVGGRWVKYTSLNDNYLFSRKSVVGRSVAVAVYVNGTLENVATITIK
jgi:hypothetical protein